MLFKYYKKSNISKFSNQQNLIQNYFISYICINEYQILITLLIAQMSQKLNDQTSQILQPNSIINQQDTLKQIKHQKITQIIESKVSNDQDVDEGTAMVPQKKVSKQNNDEDLNQTKNFGKNVVLFNTQNCTISIGPDCTLDGKLDCCFIPTFIVFATVSTLMIIYMNNNIESEVAKIITYIICIGECLSYLMVALSNPGIAHKMSQKQKLANQKTSFCRICRYDVPNKSYHCAYCDVCIIEYDHHCPWTSKCIGKNNLTQFYIFLFMTPVFIVYCAFAFGFTVQFHHEREMLTRHSK